MGQTSFEDGSVKESNCKSRLAFENGKAYHLSEDDVDDLDYDLMEEEIGLDEEETENESVNSSLKSHEYRSADEFSSAKVPPKCCCNCHQNGTPTSNPKPSKVLNGESNGTVSSSTVTVPTAFDKSYCDMSTQTLSTGDIVITMIYVKDVQENGQSVG